MRIVEQSANLISCTECPEQLIETVAKTCTNSELGDSRGFCKALLLCGYHTPFEFCDATFKFITNRGISHELIRHRLCSFVQESTRCMDDSDMLLCKPVEYSFSYEEIERSYKQLMDSGCPHEIASGVLPNSLATFIWVKANFREWRTIFGLRCATGEHPHMRDLMCMAREKLVEATGMDYYFYNVTQG